jgi:hypothetical protein
MMTPSKISLNLFIIISSLLPVYSQEPDSPATEVTIEIQHGIMTQAGTPGFFLLINNWGVLEEIEVYIIDPAGKQITLVPPDSGVRSGEDGQVSFDVPYLYGEAVPGPCLLILAGKAGIHQKMVEYPNVIPPTEDSPTWRLQFDQEPGS